MPSKNPSDSSDSLEGSVSSDKEEPDDANDDKSDSEEDTAPSTDGKTLEGNEEEFGKDEEEKDKEGEKSEEDKGKDDESDQSALLHSDSSALIEKMIKLQRQVDQQKNPERKGGESEEEEKEGSSEETTTEEGDSDESSERSLDGKGPKEIEFKTLNRIEEVASNTDQQQGGTSGTDNLSSSAQLLQELGKTADMGSEKDGESETRIPSTEGLTGEKILRRIAAIEKYRKDAESNGKDQLAVQVVERYKVCFASLSMSSCHFLQPLLLLSSFKSGT